MNQTGVVSVGSRLQARRNRDSGADINHYRSILAHGDPMRRTKACVVLSGRKESGASGATSRTGRSGCRYERGTDRRPRFCRSAANRVRCGNRGSTRVPNQHSAPHLAPSRILYLPLRKKNAIIRSLLEEQTSVCTGCVRFPSSIHCCDWRPRILPNGCIAAAGASSCPYSGPSVTYP